MVHSVRLLNKQKIAEGTKSFFFEKPTGFTYRPGQYITMTLVDPTETDALGNTRDFSLASAPHEETLEITMRMRNTAFKRTLSNLREGEKVKIDGPFGSFALHADTAKPAVILAGGIGITPFISMIRHVVHEKSPRIITLFYSNHRSEDAAFLPELESRASSQKNIKLVATMTDASGSSKAWLGERGRITAEMVKRYITETHTPIFYSAGPPQMVAAMWQLLMKMGIPEDNIRTEDFAGY